MPSPNAARNAAMRTAARAAFPGLRTHIRNGRYGAAAVAWTDGPTPGQVHTVLTQAKDYSAAGTATAGVGSTSWSIETHRTVSAWLVAVGYVRAHRRGSRYFSEDGDCPRATDPYSRVNTTWSHLEDTVAADSVTDPERRQAFALVAVAGVDPDTALDDQDRRHVRWELAHSMYHHAETVEAASGDLEGA